MSHCECGEGEEERDEGMRQRGGGGGWEAEKQTQVCKTEHLSPYLSTCCYYSQKPFIKLVLT